MRRRHLRRSLALERRDAGILIALFVSGAAALIYEVCWIRQATAIFGGTTFAVSSVVAVFFLGIALGSATFGRLAGRFQRPLLGFAAVEFGVGLLALLTPMAFDAAEPVFAAIYRASSSSGVLLFAGRVAVVGAVLIPPTFLMGATLPLFCREYVREDARVAAPVGWLYGLNTLGALAGCLVCGLWLLPEFGLDRSVAIGASLSFAAAVGVLVSFAVSAAGEDRGVGPSRREVATGAGAPISLSPRRSSVLSVLVFCAGFAAIGGQVLWIRFLALLVPNAAHVYTFTLASVLLGIVLGSALAAVLTDRARHPALAFGALQMGQGILVLVTLHLPVAWLRGLAGTLEPLGLAAGEVGFAQFAPCLLLVLPATLSGASFPVAVRLASVGASECARRVGVLTAINTLGGIGGSLALGFWVLPQLGLERAVSMQAGISIAAGVAAWWFLARREETGALPRMIATTVALSAWALVPRALGTSLPRDHLIDPGDELVASFEGLVANVAVIRKGGELSLEIDRWWQGQQSANHQRVAAHLPMLLHPNPKRILVVGVGAGQTPASFLRHEIERLDCVDIEPRVFDAVGRYFGGSTAGGDSDDGDVSTGWMDDPRVRLLVDDGRMLLAYSQERYDVISLELGQVFRPSVAPFYNIELYADARARLATGGVVAQFIPLPFFEPAELRRAVASFVSVFPSSLLWYNTSELLLLGLRDGIESVDGPRLTRELERSALRDELDFSYWGGPDRRLHHPEVLLGGFLLGPEELAGMGEGATPFRDDRPDLEYRASTRTLDPTRELENAALIAQYLAAPEHLPFLQTAGVDLEAVRAVQELNVASLVSDAHLRRVSSLRDAGRLNELEAALQTSYAANPEHALLNLTLAELSLFRGRAEEALGYIETALLSRPKDPDALKTLAVALHRSGRISEAVSAYRRAIERRPGSAELLNGLGAAEAERGNFHAARRHFERAVALEPDNTVAGRNLDRLDRLEQE